MCSLMNLPGNIRLIDNPGSNLLPATLINCYSALAIPAYRRAITVLADNLASFPIGVRQDGAKMDPPHPLDRLLKRRPNPLQNPFVFLRTLFFHAAHTGNGYARIERGGPAFAPVALWNLLPENVIPFRYDPGDGSGMAQYYFHTLDKTAYPAADVIHLQQLGYDGMSGFDPVTLHERTLQRAATLEKYQVQYLRRGTVIRGSVEIPNSLTPEQFEQVRAELRKYSGADVDQDVLILSDGAKFNNSTTSPQQSQLVEQSAATTKQIAQITGVPPEFLFELSEAKYNTSVEQAGQNIVRYCFRPWIEMAEAELTFKLLTEAEQDQGLTIHINPDALLRGDTQTQVNTVVATTNAGLTTRNEGRDRLGLPPDPDPESNKLKTLGDSTPQPKPPE